MSEQQESNLAFSFRIIHSIITRGLNVSIENLQDYSKGNYLNDKVREGFLNYIRALTSIMVSHHLAEDEIAFPYFRRKLPQAPFDAMIEEHQRMTTFVDGIRSAAERCENNALAGQEIMDLYNAFTRLREIWHPHIKVETDQFIRQADAVIPEKEQRRLVGLLGEFGQKHALPPYLTVPFMLYNLSGEERDALAQGMPAEVVQNLVPVVWKDQWETMKPFLLE